MCYVYAQYERMLGIQNMHVANKKQNKTKQNENKQQITTTKQKQQNKYKQTNKQTNKQKR